MSKITKADTNNNNLEDVDILWSTKYSCPVFILADGRRFVPATGEYAGYFEEVKDDELTKELEK